MTPVWSGVGWCARVTSTVVFNYVTMPVPSVTFNVTACAAPYPTLCSVDVVTVTVTEVDQPPVLNSTTIGVGEDSVAGALVGPPLQVSNHDPTDVNTIVLGLPSDVFTLTQIANTLAQLSVSSGVVGRLRDQGPQWWYVCACSCVCV